MEKKYIFVLHNGHLSGDITEDCKIRLDAGKQLAGKNSKTTICFVGGGGLEPEAGAVTMQKYWKEKNGNANNTFVLEKSNNTAQSVREIIEHLNAKNAPLKNAVIVSSQYHCRRIKLLCKNIPINVVSVEDVLISHGQEGIRGYLASWEYKKKKILEKLAMVYTMLDRDEKIIHFVRKIQRKNKF